MADRMTPEKEPEFGTAEWLESIDPDYRLAIAVVWARFTNEKDVATHKGTLLHLRWAVDELKQRPAEEYPGELAHLRELLRKMCRLESATPEGSPLRELLIDHYSDSRMVDASLRRRAAEIGGEPS